MNMKMKKRLTGKWLLIVLAGILFNLALPAREYHVIKDPQPTVTEDKVVYLEEVKTIGEDLGKNQFLFHPRSVAANKSNVFVYDSSQAKVFRFSPDFKLLGHFGRTGAGPGEFSGSGKLYFVQIGIGRDGNLYANDFRALRITGFNREGKHLKTYKYGNDFYTGIPVGDEKGNILWVTMKEGAVQVKNENNMVLYQLPREKVHYGFLFQDPGKYNRELYAQRTIAPNTDWKLTIDSKLLIIFKASASLAIVEKKKGYIKTLKLWPKNLLPVHKRRLEKMREEDDIPSALKGRLGRIKNSSFMPMFGKLIVDQDYKDIFYLQVAGDWRKQKIACLIYAFNQEGRLLKVIRIPIKSGEAPFTARINAKVNHTFYAIRGGDTVTLYKEKEK